MHPQHAFAADHANLQQRLVCVLGPQRYESVDREVHVRQQGRQVARPLGPQPESARQAASATRAVGTRRQAALRDGALRVRASSSDRSSTEMWPRL